jgi:hypothetical protein
MQLGVRRHFLSLTTRLGYGEHLQLLSILICSFSLVHNTFRLVGQCSACSWTLPLIVGEEPSCSSARHTWQGSRELNLTGCSIAISFSVFMMPDASVDFGSS